MFLLEGAKLLVNMHRRAAELMRLLNVNQQIEVNGCAGGKQWQQGRELVQHLYRRFKIQ